MSLIEMARAAKAKKLHPLETTTAVATDPVASSSSVDLVTTTSNSSNPDASVEPTKKKKKGTQRLVKSHTNAAQPSTARVEQLLGPENAPPEQVLQAAQNNTATVQQQLNAAKTNTTSVFYDPAAVQRHYTATHKKNNAKATSTTVPSGTRPSTASRIDTLIVAVNNNEASANNMQEDQELFPDGTIKKSGVRPVTLDEYAAKLNLLASGPADLVDDSHIERPYKLSGLSRKVDNPEYQSMMQDLQALRARRKLLTEERRSLTSGRQWLVGGANTFTNTRDAEDVRRAAMRRRLMEFAPLDSIELLKPSQRVIAINLEWRKMLTEVLGDVRSKYELTTMHYIQQTQAAPQYYEGITSLYVERIVDPVIQDYLRQVQNATYEDQPVTEQTLRSYLEEYLEARFADPKLLESTSARVTRTQTDPNAIEPDSRPNTNEEDELRVEAEYLRTALSIHASPVYMRWYNVWEKRIRADPQFVRAVASLTADQISAHFTELRSNITKMIEGQMRAQQKRTGTQIFRPFKPMTRREIQDTYRELVENEIALARSKAVIAHQDEWSTTVINYLRAAQPTNPSFDIIATRPLNWVSIATDITKMEKNSLRNDFANEPIAILEAALVSIDQRFSALLDIMIIYAPSVDPTKLLPHSPIDQPTFVFGDGKPEAMALAARNADDRMWSPFNLLYPIDKERAAVYIDQLTQNVLTHVNQFDAETAHRAASELRSILSYDYAERALLRDITTINFFLDKMFSKQRDIALSIDITVHSNDSIYFNVELEMLPDVELASRLPEAIRDERVTELVNNRPSEQYHVFWYFTPFYESTGSLAERVIYEQDLPVGVRKASLEVHPSGYIWGNDQQDTTNIRVAANETIAGAYRAVFVRIDSATPVFYTSTFVARIRVMAKCIRDGTLYEVGSHRDHGECEWKEYAQDSAMLDAIAEWRILVERGQEAFEQLVTRRAAENKLLKQTGEDFELFLPPWGREDEESLLKTFLRSCSDKTFEERFEFDGICKRVVKRIGGQMRRFLRKFVEHFESTTGLPSAKEQEFKASIAELKRLATGGSNMELFSILVDETVASSTAIRLAHIATALEAQTGIWSEEFANKQTVQSDDDDNGDTASTNRAKTEREFFSILQEPFLATSALMKLFTVAFSDEEYGKYKETIKELMPSLAADVAENEAFAGLPQSKVIRIQSRYRGSIESLPLATIISTMEIPAVWSNLTWRERRFFSRLRDRFDVFTKLYREKERREIYYSTILQGNRALHRIIVPYGVDDLFTLPDDQELAPTPIQTTIENQIDEQLANMAARDIRYAPTWTDAPTTVGLTLTNDHDAQGGYFLRTFLQDEDSCREYQAVIRRLVTAGLLVPNTFGPGTNRSFVNDRNCNTLTSTILQTQIDYKVRDGRTKPNDASSRRSWSGVHSYTNLQPEFCEIIIDEKRGAAVEKRGSVPLGKGYDFDGLAQVIADTADAFTSLVQAKNTQTVPENERQRTLKKHRARLERLELIYNFLAFVAHPTYNGVFMGVEAITNFVNSENSEKWLANLRALM